MRPEITALIDQADAAHVHAQAVMAEVARLDGTPVQHVTPGGILVALIRNLRQRALAGRLTICPHLSYSSPEPAYWCAWAPGRIRCARCATVAARRIKGTKEDRRCDHCRRLVPRIHADMAQLPPIVADLPPYPPACVPPITMHFGLCPACQRADQSERPAEAGRSSQRKDRS